MRNALAAVLTVAAVGLGGCTQTVPGRPPAGTPDGRSAGSSATPAPSPAAQGTVRFGGCAGLAAGGISVPSGSRDGLQFSCARIRVPLDYGRPRGATIRLQLFRVHDPRTSSPRSLFVDPGGPGASAVAFLASSYRAFHSLFGHFDLMAVDPRGTTFSAPVRCVSDRERDALVSAAPDMTTTAGFRRAQQLAADFASGCRQAAGPALRFYDTVTTARDMDRVRAALRLPALDYLGFSYGTELGAAYAHLFPRRTGAIVLDGAVDPLLSGLDLLTQQMQGFEAAFDQFAAWCRRHSSCSTLDDPRGAAEQILATTAREPLPTGQPRRLTATLADIGIAEALYSQALWPTLATALVQARSGVGAGLLALADEYYQRRSDGSYSNLFDAYNVIWCNDSPRGPSDARLRATVQSWARRFPIFGKWSALQLFMCQRWPVPPTVLPRPTAATPTKVLVLGNLHDPATPYRGTKDLARAMGNAEVLTWNGQGHTSYLQGSGCIDRYVDDYLISAELPPEGTVCRK